jgi:SSS family transporter
LTAIVLAAVYVAFVPDANPNTIIIASIILLGVVMIIFTFYGGMEAVIWVEVVQLGIYIGGAIAAAWVILSQVDGGMSRVLELGNQFNKFQVLDFSLNFTKTYTFWGGLIGGCFLTMSTHGTDQYLVQRYLCTDKPSAAATALLSSGAVVLGQFIGFLFIGVLLFAFYQPFSDAGYEAVKAGQATLPLNGVFTAVGTDQVFPDFITKHMPSGLSGLVVAAIFAAALSSSLNSIAATFVEDLYKPFVKGKTDKHFLKVAGVLTVVVGIIQIVVAIISMSIGQSALSKALSVAGLINGPILGVFLVGTFVKKANQTAALIGMLASISLMVYVAFGTSIAFPWYPVIGSLTTLIVAGLASVVIAEKK